MEDDTLKEWECFSKVNFSQQNKVLTLSTTSTDENNWILNQIEQAPVVLEEYKKAIHPDTALNTFEDKNNMPLDKASSMDKRHTTTLKMFDEFSDKEQFDYDLEESNTKIPKKCPYTSILNKYKEFEPICDKVIYSRGGKECDSDRHLHRVILNDKREFILKCIRINTPQKNEYKIDQVFSEFFIGKTIGSFTKHVAKIFDMMNIKINDEICCEILMENAGTSLDNLDIAKDSLTDKDELLVSIIGQLIHILTLCEEIGIAHFDIKPANIVLSGSILKLIDFGTCISFFSDPVDVKYQLAKNKCIGYTEVFAPPEILESAKGIQKIYPNKFDIFSFGRTLLFILLKFEQCDKFFDETSEDLMKFLKEKYTKECRKWPWERILDACLNSDPNQRPTFAEVKEMFTAALKIFSIDKNLEFKFENIEEVLDHFLIGNEFKKLAQIDISAIHYNKYLDKIKKTDEIKIVARNCAEIFKIYYYDKKYETILNKITQVYVNLFGTDFNNLEKISEILEIEAHANFLHYQYSITYWKKIIELFKSIYDENHLFFVKFYNKLATAYINYGNRNKAADYYIKEINLKKKTIGESHPDIAELYDKLICVFNNSGLHDRAIDYFNKAIEIKLEVFGENHSEIAKSYDELAKIYAYTKEYDKVLDICNRATLIRKKALGENHIDITKSYDELSQMYASLNQFDKAFEYCNKATEIRIKVPREKSSDITQSYEKLAEVFSTMGQESKCIDCYIFAIEIMKKNYREYDLYLTQLYEKLATSYSKSNQPEKAIDFYNKVIEVNKKESKTSAFDYIKIKKLYEKMANEFLVVRQKRKAVECLIKAIEMNLNFFSENRFNISEQPIKLAVCYTHTAKFNNEFDFFNHAVEILNKMPGNNPADYIKVYDLLASSFAESREFDKSILCIKKAIKYKKKAFDNSQYDIEELYMKFALIYHDSYQFEKEISCYNIIMKIKKKMHGESDPIIAELYEKIAKAYSNCMQQDKALEYLNKMLDIYKKVYGVNNFHVEQSYYILASEYESSHQYDKAINCLDKAIKIRKKLDSERKMKITYSFNSMTVLDPKLCQNEKTMEFPIKAAEDNQNDLFEAYDKLASVYAISGNHDKALEFCNNAIEVRKYILGDNFDIDISINNLASAYSKAGEHTRAIDLCHKAHDSRSKKFGENSWGMTYSFDELASAYAASGQYDKAIKFCNKAIELRNKYSTGSKPETSESCEKLAAAYAKSGQHDKAFMLCNTTNELAPENNSLILASYDKLACVYENFKKFDLAKKCRDKARISKEMAHKK